MPVQVRWGRIGREKVELLHEMMSPLAESAKSFRARGLEVLLGRLAAMRAVIEKIAVESGGTKQLAEGKRVLKLGYPVRVGGLEDLVRVPADRDHQDRRIVIS